MDQKKIDSALKAFEGLFDEAIDSLNAAYAEFQEALSSDLPEKKVEQENTPRKTQLKTDELDKFDKMGRAELIEMAEANKIPITTGRGSNTNKIRADIKEYVRTMNGVTIPDVEGGKPPVEDGPCLREQLEVYHSMTECSFECMPAVSLENCPYGDTPQFPCQNLIVEEGKK